MGLALINNNASIFLANIELAGRWCDSYCLMIDEESKDVENMILTYQPNKIKTFDVKN